MSSLNPKRTIKNTFENYSSFPRNITIICLLIIYIYIIIQEYYNNLSKEKM